MKIELIRKVEKYTGNVSFYTQIDGMFISGSVAFTETDAIEKYDAAFAKAKLYLNEEKTVVKTAELES